MVVRVVRVVRNITPIYYNLLFIKKREINNIYTMFLKTYYFYYRTPKALAYKQMNGIKHSLPQTTFTTALTEKRCKNEFRSFL